MILEWLCALIYFQTYTDADLSAIRSVKCGRRCLCSLRQGIFACCSMTGHVRQSRRNEPWLPMVTCCPGFRSERLDAKWWRAHA